MEAIRNILVALDFTEADQNLMRYTQFLKQIIEPDSIHFVHALKPEWIPEEMEKTYSQHIQKPVKEQLQEDIQKQVSEFIDGDNIRIESVIKKGQPFETILKYSHEEDSDLIVVGEKHESQGSGILASQLTRKATCSILYVPDSRKEPRIDNVLIPLDFSKYSDMALEFAQELNKKASIKKIYHQNIYHTVPSYNMMKTYGQMRSNMKQNAREAYENYMERLKLDLDKDKIHTIFTADDKNKPAYHILEEAEKNLCDLIIMGSKGQSNAAAMFLGSTTEKLLKHDKQVPVLILKNKGENRSLMESLFYAD